MNYVSFSILNEQRPAHCQKTNNIINPSRDASYVVTKLRHRDPTLPRMQ